MLAKQEAVVVKTVLEECGDKNATLISQSELHIKVNEHLAEKKQLNSEQLDKIMHTLEIDGYFDVVNSDRKGEHVYVITLHNKAQAFEREEEQTKRKVFFDLKIKILLAVLGAVVAFVIGIILKNIF